MRCLSHKIGNKEILNALLSCSWIMFFSLKLILCGFNYVKIVGNCVGYLNQSHSSKTNLFIVLNPQNLPTFKKKVADAFLTSLLAKQVYHPSLLGAAF